MFTRVGGATLALVAAVALALSVAGAMGPVPGWWSGHPNVQGTLIKAKEVDIGLVRSRGCNTGGDRTCQPVDLTGTVATTGYVAGAVTALLTGASVLLAFAIALQRERRRSLAKLAVFAVVVAGIVAIALIVQGPGIEARTPDHRLLSVSVPLGLGTYLFAAGMLSAIVASVLALRPTAAPRRVAPRVSLRQVGVGPAAAAPQPGVDVLALLQDDTLRPSSLRPEPRMGRQSPMPPGSGGALPGPSGPLGAPQLGGAQPLFQAAPQLRPLYEAAPNLGGTGGFVPSQQALRRMRPPTPIPREQISALAGIPTPPPFDALPEASGYGYDHGAATAEPESAAGDPMDDDDAFAPPPPPAPRRHPPSWPPGVPSAPMAAASPLASPLDPASRRVSTALGAPAAPMPPTSAFTAGPPPPQPPAFASAPPPAPPAFSDAPPPPRSPKTLPPPLRNKSPSTAPPPSISSAAPQPRPPAAAPVPRPLPNPGSSGVAAPRPAPNPGSAGVAAPRPAPNPGSAGVPAPRPLPNPGSAGVPAPRPLNNPGSAGVPRPLNNPGSAGVPRPLNNPGSAGARATAAPGAPFVPTVPFPAPSAKARTPRVETDPIERASTEAFSEETQDRQEDSTMALLRGVGDATGRVEAPPDFGASTSDELADTHSVAKANPTDLDLPLVKPPPGAAAAAAADDTVDVPLADTADVAPAVGAAAAPAKAAAASAAAPAKAAAASATAPAKASSAAAPASASAKAAAATTAPVPTLAAPSAAPATSAAAPEPSPSSSSSTKLPISTAPSSLPPPSEKQSATSGPSPACPQCEAPMAWVEEHLRFYCKSCKMYF
jgi:hypothetical protein